MKKRIAYLILVFAVIFIFFILQKPFFMLYNDAPGRLVPFSSYLQVMFHGMSLDAATTGYLTAIPCLPYSLVYGSRNFLSVNYL